MSACHIAVTHPMLRRRPQARNGVLVRSGAIAFMVSQPVARVALRQAIHKSVPRHLGQDAGRRNAPRGRISTNDRQLWGRDAGDAEGVGKHIAWLHLELRHRAAHAGDVGVLNAESVYGSGINVHNGPRQRATLDDRAPTVLGPRDSTSWNHQGALSLE